MLPLAFYGILAAGILAAGIGGIFAAFLMGVVGASKPVAIGGAVIVAYMVGDLVGRYVKNLEDRP